MELRILGHLLLLAGAGLVKATSTDDCNITAPSTLNQSTKDACCKLKGLGCDHAEKTGDKENAAATARQVSEPFDCSPSSTGKWSMTKQLWCCQYKHAGCSYTPNTSSTPTQPASDTPTQAPPSTTPRPDTYASLGCDTVCLYAGRSASCGRRVGWAATHRFLSNPHSCKRSYDFVLEYCPMCKVCAFDDSGCADQVVPACDTVCDHNNTSASCTFRIQWAANHRFAGQPHACTLAHRFVLQQCSSCSECRPSATDCKLTAISAPKERTTVERYDCSDGNVIAWPVEKNKWCCDHESVGCAPTGAPMNYDCEAGYTHWQLGWSVPKKEWCCEHFNLGCPQTSFQGADDPDSDEVSYDCEAGYSNFLEEWGHEQKLWCCRNRDRGCPPAPVPVPSPSVAASLPFDCADGHNNWELGWSSSKKTWCCEHGGRGCATSTTSVSAPYDCRESYAFWKEKWSPDKTHWCCKHLGLGCLPAPSPSISIADELIASNQINQPAPRQHGLAPPWGSLGVTPALTVGLLAGCLGFAAVLALARGCSRRAGPSLAQHYTELRTLEADYSSSWN